MLENRIVMINTQMIHKMQYTRNYVIIMLDEVLKIMKEFLIRN
jgi:hypothetical protein